MISFDLHGWDCRVVHLGRTPRNDREVALLLRLFRRGGRGEAVAISNLDNIVYTWGRNYAHRRYDKGKAMLKKLAVGFYQANCYIVGSDHAKEGVVIDPGDEVTRIVKEITKSELSIRYILITHGHFDHSGAAGEVRGITKAPVFIHRLDAPALDFVPDGYLEEGQELQVGTYTISVLHTPGHSPGGVSFVAPGAVFTGDTLFAGSIGRSDFSGGDYHQLIAGIKKKLFPLGDDLRVYPGHGPRTTIGQERRTNPFCRDWVTMKTGQEYS